LVLLIACKTTSTPAQPARGVASLEMPLEMLNVARVAAKNRALSQAGLTRQTQQQKNNQDLGTNKGRHL